MALNFPNNPTQDQIYNAEGTSYQWKTDRWVKVGGEGGSIQEFHDPTGAASWRIVGNTLECWGSYNGDAATITFPKTFARIPTITAVGGLVSGDQASSCTVYGKSETQFIISTSTMSGSPSTGEKNWHAIGEWDGVS